MKGSPMPFDKAEPMPMGDHTVTIERVAKYNKNGNEGDPRVIVVMGDRNERESCLFLKLKPGTEWSEKKWTGIFAALGFEGKEARPDRFDLLQAEVGASIRITVGTKGFVDETQALESGEATGKDIPF